MGVFDRLFGRTVAEPVAAQPLEIGAPITSDRIAARLERLFLYQIQKKGMTEEKRKEVQIEINKLAHTLAAKGLPLIKSYEQLKEVFDGRGNA